ncbi:LPS export ABC transporter permease LptG [Utexia brackfieldae]|uniref:LPS export ABC transporter permease LptG n=1 Tax=Utexia brackfieldae TaxID=3074108 RepID=UPI00370DAE65
MFGILDRYIGKTILKTIGLTLFMLVGLSGIIRFIDQLRKVSEDYDALSAAYYCLLTVPKDLEVFFPIAALLGALIGLGTLAAKSELVVMETAGFSRISIAKAVMKTAIPLVLLTMIVGEWVAPVSEQIATNMRSEKIYGRSLIATQNSIWAKDGDDFIHIGRVNNDDTISDIDIYALNDGRLVRLTHAAYGKYQDHEWLLTQVDESDLSNPDKISGTSLLTMNWKTNITPDKLGIVALDPGSLSASGLYKYINYLKTSGRDSANYQLIFWKKIFKPFSVAVMMLMALSFIFGPLRSVPMGIRVLTGITFGFLFYISDMLFSQISIVAGFKPFIGALLTSVLFLLISLYLLNKKR